MAGGLTEDALVEQPALRLLRDLGWKIASGFDETLGQWGTLGRDSQSDVVLVHRLRDALCRINLGVPGDAIETAIERLIANRSALDRVRANQEIYRLLRDGTKVETEVNGKRETVTVRFVHWDVADSNDWLAVSQLWVAGEMYKRRADIVLFVNGIPLVFIELKVSHKNVRHAYDDNLRDYRDSIGRIFWFNAFVILSNGSDTKVGATYAPWDLFAEWKKINSEGDVGIVSLETALRGTCDRYRLLDIVENFVTYTERPGGLAKAVAKNHQYLGVNQAIEALHEARTTESTRLGVFWHTQGSGKSLSNLWFTQKVLRKLPGNWTFVEVTDRKELDDQLYGEFVDSGVVTAGENVHAESSAHLRELLGQNHRYVFTLIHKFIPPEKGAKMPVLSSRRDIIVITDEAHRSQYDTLAWNMRQALPHASFLGFTGTPLISGEEELTKQVFGGYVSMYNFRDSISDGATVPLYYENRIPELQLTNADFDAELDELLEDAALDEAQEKAVARQFSRQYHLITRTERLEEIAADLVRHFVGRGFRGKGMYVAIDKATAIRMYELVQRAWAAQLAELEAELVTTPQLERPPLEAAIQFMRTTDMAVVVSQAQNEMADMDALGLDIVPHRQRMNNEDLAAKFKDPEHPFRLVFVCAMWLTGFDAPSCSTVYLDKPMRNHTLMQTIARANRVFPEKDSGLIVDYVGVFRNLEAALAIYGAGRQGDGASPIQPKDRLAAELVEALEQVADFLDANDIDLADLEVAKGFEFVALQKSAVEALLIDDATRRQYVSLAHQVRTIFKSLLPDPAAQAVTHRVAVIRSLATKLESASEAPDISDVMDSVGELLDRSVGAEEYLIRTGGDAEPLVDLNRLDFEQLALQFAGNKRTAVKGIERNLERRLDSAVRKNPTRGELAERFRRLIDEYNAGTHNLEEFFRRLKAINDELTEEEQRTVREDLTEEELAIYDLLTKPEPRLTNAEAATVKEAAKHLLERVTDKLVVDWRKRQHTRAAVRLVVISVLDNELPEEVYGSSLFDEKVDRVYEHIYASYFDNDASVYTKFSEVGPATESLATMPTTRGEIDDALLAQITNNPALFAKVMEEVFGVHETWAMPTERLLTEENRHVEFKASARWSRTSTNPKVHKTLAEEIIAKTVAGFLNGQGGTLLIGVNDHGQPVGLDPDYAQVSPQNADGFVNWLDTMLDNTLGHTGAHRVQIRIDVIGGIEVCRVDVPASSKPIWTHFKKQDAVLFVRRNNSTRQIPALEVDQFLAERFG
ncbi:HsdR family type I site-specific deoxyribonuclease [Streptomyces capoamus]|uniref:HsdR family type I site-specific deoxyribonuclease n=1 Tax=Streptomyces capoamus TaxID=68183 RepID=UPI003390AED3